MIKMINLRDLNKDDDLIHVTATRDVVFLNNQFNYFVKEILNVAKVGIGKGLIGVLNEDMGLECRLLQVEKGKWQKGKLVLTLQFIPDETDSTDEISDIRKNKNVEWQ